MSINLKHAIHSKISSRDSWDDDDYSNVAPVDNWEDYDYIETPAVCVKKSPASAVASKTVVPPNATVNKSLTPLTTQLGVIARAPVCIQADDAASQPRAATSFNELDLKPDVLKGILAQGWERPSPVQRDAIAAIMRGVDVIAASPSGSGKTGAYVVPILNMVDHQRNDTQALLLVPTVVLAHQVKSVFDSLSKHMSSRPKIELHCGGSRYQRELSRAQVVVGTPNRVLELIDRGLLDLRTIRLAVFDEADEIVDNEELFSQLRRLVINQNSQTAFFSATIKESTIDRLVDYEMVKAGHVVVQPSRESSAVKPAIQHFHLQMEVDHGNQEWEVRLETVVELCNMFGACGIVVFMRTKKQIEFAMTTLSTIYPRFAHRFTTDVAKFQSIRNLVLVASDECSRGIDVPGVACVINFEVPRDETVYTQRVGRAGRFGKSGTAITLVGPGGKNFRWLVEGLGFDLPHLPANCQQLPGYGEVSLPAVAPKFVVKAATAPSSGQEATPSVAAPCGIQRAVSAEEFPELVTAKSPAVPSTPAALIPMPMSLIPMPISLPKPTPWTGAQTVVIEAETGELAARVKELEQLVLKLQQDLAQEREDRARAIEESEKRMMAEFAALLVLSSNSSSTVASSASLVSSDSREAEEVKEADISPESLAAPIAISFSDLVSEEEVLPEGFTVEEQSVSVLADATNVSTEEDISASEPEPNLPDSSWKTVSSKAAAKKPKSEKPKRWIGANGKFSSTVSLDKLSLGEAYRGEVISVTPMGSFIRFGNDAIISSKDGMVRKTLEKGTWHHVEVKRVSNGKVDLNYLAPL